MKKIISLALVIMIISSSMAIFGLSASATGTLDYAEMSYNAYLQTYYAIDGSNVQVGDQVLAELDCKYEGTSASVNEWVINIQANDGASYPYYAYNVSAPEIGVRATLAPTAISTCASGQSGMWISIYNKNGQDNKLKVYSFKLYVMRNGVRVDIALPALDAWVNSATTFTYVQETPQTHKVSTAVEIVGGSSVGYMTDALTVDGTNIKEGDQFNIDLDIKFEGTEFPAMNYYLIVQRNDGTHMLLEYNTSVKDLRQTISCTPNGTANTIVSGQTQIYVNLYNQTGPDFKITVYDVKPYVMRDGVRIDLTMKPLNEWNHFQTRIVQVDGFDIGTASDIVELNNNGYFYTGDGVEVGADKPIHEGDEVYAVVDAKTDGTDDATGQPYFRIQRQDAAYIAFNTTFDITQTRSLIPGKVVTTGDSNKITSAVTKIYLSFYNFKGDTFKLTIYGVHLYVIRDGVKIEISLPTFSSSSWISSPYTTLDNAFGGYAKSATNIITNVNTLTQVSTLKGSILPVTGLTVSYFKDAEAATPLADTDIVGTGAKVKVFNGSNLVNTYSVVIYGDVTGDGKIGLGDLIAIKKHILSIPDATLTGEKLLAGKIAKNETISVSDLMLIKKHLLAITPIIQS